MSIPRGEFYIRLMVDDSQSPNGSIGPLTEDEVRAALADRVRITECVDGEEGDGFVLCHVDATERFKPLRPACRCDVVHDKYCGV